MAAAAGNDPDPLVKVLNTVKETLVRLMSQASMAVQQNAEVEQGIKSAKGGIHGLEKSLEDFYAACDQLQLCLNRIKSIEELTQHSMKYTPKLVSSGKQDPDQDTQPYSEYLSTVKAQTKIARELQDMLAEFARSSLTTK